MMKKTWLLTIGLVLMLAMVVLAGCQPDSTTLGEIEGININSQQEGIWVSGTGEVFAVSDIVDLRLGIEAQEASVTEAQTKATEAMSMLMTALTDNGVAEKDIQTHYFNIRQVTKWDRDTEEEVVTGYRVTHMKTVRIRDIDEAGVIIDAVAEAGGDLARIDSIAFSIDDPSDYYEEAREEAMAEAEAKAEQLAELAGVSLGKPTYISEGSISIPRPTYQAGMEIEEAVALPTSISPGETEVSLTVQVVYAILN